MPRRKSAGLMLCSALALASWDASAQAQWKLTWEAPVDCPRREDVLAAMRDIVGEAIFRATSLEADGRIRKVEEGYRLELSIANEDGPRVRSVDAKVCHDLLGASAVVLGLHVKRLAAQSESGADNANDERADSASAGEQGLEPSPTSAPAAPETDPETTPSNEATNAEFASTQRERRWWLALPQGSVVVGSLPDVAWVGGAAVGWRSDAWRVWVTGRYQFPQTVAADAVPNVGVMVDKYSVELGVSHSWSNPWADVALGLSGGLDYVVAGGIGDDVAPSRARGAAAYVGGGLTFRWLVTDWLSLAAGAVGEVPLTRPSFEVASLGAIGRFNPVHLRISLGPEWNF